MPEETQPIVEPVVEALPVETIDLTYTLDGKEVTFTVNKPADKLYYRVDEKTNRFLHATANEFEFSADPADTYSYGEYDTSGPNEMLTYYLLGKFVYNLDSEEFAELVTRIIISVTTAEDGKLNLVTSLRPKPLTPPEPDEYIPPDESLVD
jgi:hypothetical protein